MPPKKPVQPVPKGKVVNKKPPTVNKNAKVQPASKAPKKATKPEEKKVVKPTKETLAAKVIQRCVRKFLRKCRIINEKKKKILYEEEMDRLQKEAYVLLVKAEQAEVEREYLIKEAEMKQRLEKKKRIKRMLEASFDGELDDIIKLFDEVKLIDDEKKIETEGYGKMVRDKNLMELVECEDANKNSALSEASSGGDVETVRILVKMGAELNTVGHFRRTPLYRAAFAGHHLVCKLLLEHGADPRITAEDNQTPFEVSSLEAVKEVLDTWDIAETIKLIEGLQQVKLERSEMNDNRMEHENNELLDTIKKCEEDYTISQKLLCKARQEYEKRIKEHDLAVAEGYSKPENTIQAIKDSEVHLVLIELDVSKTLEALQMAKLRHREKKEESDKEKGIDTFAGLTINIRELDDVLMRDVGDKIKSSNRYPLLIDKSGQSSVFLRYRDTNYLNVLQQRNMKPEIIRKALLGAVRYGKYMILDTMDVNMYEIYNEVFDLIEPNLLESIFNQSFINDRGYLKLIRKEDGEEYNKNNFNDDSAAKFKLVVITTNYYPEQILMDSCYPIKIIVTK